MEKPEVSLNDKLGLKEGMSTYFLKAPSEYWQVLGSRPQPYDDVDGEYDFIHAFFTDKEALENFADILSSKLKNSGMMWISWPKVSARKELDSDITEQDLRDIFIPFGLVDVKVCSVTDLWSGLKFVWRKSQ